MRSLMEGIGAALVWAEQNNMGNEAAILERMFNLGQNVSHIDMTRVMHDVGLDLGLINEDEKNNLAGQLDEPVEGEGEGEERREAGQEPAYNPLDPFATDRERRLRRGEHPASIAVDHGRATSLLGLSTVINTTQSISRPVMPNSGLQQRPGGEEQPAVASAQASADDRREAEERETEERNRREAEERQEREQREQRAQEAPTLGPQVSRGARPNKPSGAFDL